MRRVAAGVFVAVFLLGAVSALLTPLMALPDEPAHAIHAAAVVRGQVLGPDQVIEAHDGWTATVTPVRLPAGYATLNDVPTCYALDASTPASCAPEIADGRSTVDAVTTAGTYNPVYYAAVGWPSLGLPPAVALYGMRVLSVMLTAALVATAAVSLLRLGTGAWGLAALAVAFTPMAVHLAGGVNPSALEIGGALALWTASAELLVARVTRGAILRVVVAVAAVAVARPLGSVWALGLPLLVAVGLSSRARTEALWRHAGVRRGALVATAVVVGAAAWIVLRGTLDGFSGTPDPTLTGAAAIRGSLARTPDRVAQMIGVLGWADTLLPSPLIRIWLLAWAGLVGAGIVLGRWRERVVLAALAAVPVVLPVVAEWGAAAEIGFAWQGRYTLPVAAGAPLLAAVVLARRRPVGPVWPTVLVAAAGAGHVVALLANARRFQLGSGAGLLSPLTDGRWEPPIDDVLLLGIAALVAVSAPVAVARLLPLLPQEGDLLGERADPLLES